MLYVRFIHKHLGIVSFENVVRVWWVPSTSRNPGDSIAVKVKGDSVEKSYLVENVSDFECRPTPAPAGDVDTPLEDSPWETGKRRGAVVTPPATEPNQ